MTKKSTRAVRSSGMGTYRNYFRARCPDTPTAAQELPAAAVFLGKAPR
jgi:hypothetical protein